MVTTEIEALEKICIPLLTGGSRMQPKEPTFCIGSKCFAYWRWGDETHIKGYCAIAGKPEVE